MKEEKSLSYYLIRIGIFILILVIPLVFTELTHERFILPRVTILRIFIPIIFLLWCIGKVSGKKNLTVSPVFYYAGAFIAILFIAALFSGNFGVSMQGVYGSYSWGFSSMFAGFLLFIVVSDEFDYGHWEAAGLFLTFAAFIVSAYGLTQVLGFDPVHKAGVSFDRIFSTMGNPNFLGGYLVVCFPVVIVFYLTAVTRYRPFLLLTLSLMVINLGMTLSRASWLAFAVSGLAFFILIGRENIVKKSRDIITAVVVLVLVSGLLIIGRKSLESAGSVEKSVVKERLGVMLDSEEQSASYRLETWKSALKMFKEHPLLGVGPDMFEYFFPQYETLKFARATGAREVSNSAHNTLLQTASTTGIFGLIAYISLWFVSFKSGISQVLAEEGEKKFFAAALVSSLAALFVFLQFHFFLPETLLYFWLLEGALVFCRKQDNKSVDLSGTVKKLMIVSAAVIAVLFSYFAVRFFLADYYFRKAKFRSYRKAVELNPSEWLYRRTLITSCLNASKAVKNKLLEKELLDEALKNAELNVKHYPYNVWTNHHLGLAYVWQWQFSKDEKLLKNARKYLEKSYRIAPFVKDVSLNLIRVYLLGRNKELAGRHIEQVEKMFPDSETEELQKLKKELRKLEKSEVFVK
ncbi:MAG: O-antigen ligase family protein [bacterium]